jgi:hypothetical protein
MDHLDTESAEFIRDLLIGTCLDGQCYEFAFAVSRGTGYPMIGLIVDDVIRHVAVALPDGRYLDARGIFAASTHLIKPDQLGRTLR